MFGQLPDALAEQWLHNFSGGGIGAQQIQACGRANPQVLRFVVLHKLNAGIGRYRRADLAPVSALRVELPQAMAPGGHPKIILTVVDDLTVTERRACIGRTKTQVLGAVKA